MRGVLQNDKFVVWANDNIYVVVGHSDTGHEPVDGKCPIYPGLTCEQHQAASGAMASGEPKIPQKGGVPNSWLIAPNGEVKEVEPVNQQVVGKIIDLVDEWQKTLGARLSLKDYDKYQKAFVDGDAALAKLEWKAALIAYARTDKKKLPAALVQQLKDKLAAVDQKVAEAFTALKDSQDDLKIKKASMAKLLDQVSVSFTTGYIATKAEIETWLKSNK